MTDNRKQTQRIILPKPDPDKVEVEREANRRHQDAWRRRHFLLHGEIIKVMESFRAMPPLLDKLENPTLAKKIRKALAMMED